MRWTIWRREQAEGEKRPSPLKRHAHRSEASLTPTATASAPIPIRCHARPALPRPAPASPRRRRCSLPGSPATTMPSSLYIPFLLGGMILTVRASCGILDRRSFTCRDPQTPSGASGRCASPHRTPYWRSPSPGHAMRRELRRPRPLQARPLRTASMADPPDVPCVVIYPLLAFPFSLSGPVGEMLCQSTRLLSFITSSHPNRLLARCVRMASNSIPAPCSPIGGRFRTRHQTRSRPPFASRRLEGLAPLDPSCLRSYGNNRL